MKIFKTEMLKWDHVSLGCICDSLILLVRQVSFNLLGQNTNFLVRAVFNQVLAFF